MVCVGSGDAKAWCAEPEAASACELRNRSTGGRAQQSRETIANREGEMTIQFNVNGKPASTDAPPQTPLLWVIREGLKLTGTKFGCGTGLCGACMVHIDGKRAFSCQTQVSEVAGKSVTTI